MNGLPYYKAYPRDFIEGTIGMPFEVKCAYRVVLDLIYMHGGKLPDDAHYISGILGCSVRRWGAVRSALIEADKLQVEDGHLGNYRAIIELESLRKVQDKQRENASGPRKNKSLAEPPLRHTESDTEPEVVSKEETEAKASGDSAPIVVVPDPPPADPEPSVPETGQGWSDEDRFWGMASTASKRGIPKSMMGQLANALGGEFDRALGIMADAMQAKQPRPYLAKIVMNLRIENNPPPVVRDPSLPDWVSDARQQGWDIEHEGPWWRMGGSLYDDAGEQIGA